MQEFDHLSQVWLNETRKEAAPKTTGRRLTSLRSWARWAKWATELHEYNAPTPGKAIPHPLPERLDGLERLLEVASTPDQRALIGACGFIGMRVGEALAFDTSWFNPHEMMMTIRGKGDRTRNVPVSARAWDAISEAYIRAMMTPDKKVINYEDRAARKCITSLGRKARLVRDISSHDLRATFATVLADSGVRPRVIQELLGHSQLSTTEIYMGVEMEALKEAVNF